MNAADTQKFAALTQIYLLLEKGIGMMPTLHPRLRLVRMPTFIEVLEGTLPIARIHPRLSGSVWIYTVEVRKNCRGEWNPDADPESGASTFYCINSTTLVPAVRIILLYLYEAALNKVLQADGSAFTLF